jgi:hypothetical protein
MHASSLHREFRENQPTWRRAALVDARSLTTGAAARVLHVTPQGVRYLIRTGQLPSEQTTTGQFLVRPDDVIQLAETRLHAALGPVHLTRRAPRGEPRQLALFSQARLRLVGSFAHAEVLCDRQAKALAIVRQFDTVTSDKKSSVNLHGRV